MSCAVHKDSLTYAIQSLTALIPHPGLFLMFLLGNRR